MEIGSTLNILFGFFKGIKEVFMTMAIVMFVVLFGFAFLCMAEGN